MALHDDWKRDLADITFARMPIIVCTALGVAVAAFAFAIFATPRYAAFGSLLLRSKTVQSATETLESRVDRIPELTEQDLVSEQQLFLSGALVERTIQKLLDNGSIESPADALGPQRRGGLRAMKKWLKGLLASDAADVGPGSVMAETVGAILMDQLSAHVVDESNVIRLRLEGPDAGAAERFLDTLMSEYLQYRIVVLHPPNQRLFYRDRRDFYSDRLQALESQLVDATDAVSVTDLETEIANNITLQTTLLERHSELRSRYLEQEQSVTMLADALANETVTHFAFLENMVLDTLNEQLLALTIERGRMQRQFLDTSPQLVALNASISETQMRLKEEVEAIHQDAAEKLKMLGVQIKLLEFSQAELKDKTDSLQSEAMQFRQLSREADLLRTSYESFARRSEEAEISEAVGASSASGDVTVLSRPAFSSVKIFPRVSLILVMGLMLGVVAGCSLAFVTEFFDHTIRRPSDVEAFTSLPVIGSIRHVASVRSGKR